MRRLCCNHRRGDKGCGVTDGKEHLDLILRKDLAKPFQVFHGVREKFVVVNTFFGRSKENRQT